MLFWKQLIRIRKQNCIILLILVFWTCFYYYGQSSLPDFSKEFRKPIPDQELPDFNFYTKFRKPIIHDYPDSEKMLPDSPKLSMEAVIRVIPEEQVCHIPTINPFEAQSLEVIKAETDQHITPVCRHHSTVKFHADSQSSNLNRLHPGSEYWLTTSCCYVGFDHQGKGNTEACISITSDTTLIAETFAFINVKCGGNGAAADYQDQFQFFRLNPEIQSKQAELARNHSDQDRPNIIIYGVDAISHVNFIRSFPKSYQLIMSNLAGLEFSGRNKIALNTIPNLTGALAGHFNCNGTACQLIWNRFAKVGYSTLKAEDDVDGHSLTVHFYPQMAEWDPKDQLVAHYDQLPYLRKMRELNVKKPSYANFGCFDYQWTQLIVQQRILNVAKAFAAGRLNTTPYFHFTWSAFATHNVVGFAKYLDDPLFNLLTSLLNGNLLNNTILVLFSDHGVTYNEYSRTVEGAMETRMPFMFFVFPPWFLRKYSLAVRNMRSNSNRLTTPYDVHETLLDLLNLSSVANPSVRHRSKNIRLSESQGMSLFLPVPRNRSCVSANIPDQWCICCSKKTIETSVEDRNVSRVVSFAMGIIQEKLALFPQCANLSLSRVEDARKVQPCAFSEMTYETYLVQFITWPGQALFEAPVAIDESTDELRLVGTIDRLNSYGSQSACLDSLVSDELVRWMQSVCLCKNFN